MIWGPAVNVRIRVQISVFCQREILYSSTRVVFFDNVLLHLTRFSSIRDEGPPSHVPFFFLMIHNLAFF